MTMRGCESVGIDLGTTYSSLAYMDSRLMPLILSDCSGQSVMPSAVFFDDDEIIVGELALQHARLHPDRVVQFIKVHMGDAWRREIRGVVHTPESISAIILGQLINDAEPQIGPVRTAVITVPAYFTEKRRRATQQAGEIAGLKVTGTLNEPMAATLAYGLHHTDQEQIAAVYDLGGGTFDVTVVRIAPNELEELATNGNRRLGGKDWDQVLIDFLADDFQDAHGLDLRGDAQAMQDLILEAERAKRRLTRMPKTTIRVSAMGRERRVDLTRQQFEEMTEHLLHTTRLTTEIALRDAGLTWSRISRVVLVGGSTHMPAVRQMLRQASGKPVETGVNPVLAVALGAAIYAHILETGQKFQAKQAAEAVQPLEESKAGEPLEESKADEMTGAISPLPTTENLPAVRFVTAHGVGLKVRAGTGWCNRVLIPKNTQVPAKVTKRFLTRSSGGRGSRIRVEITQGDTPDIALAEALGTGLIKGIPPDEPEGRPVDVTMAFDEQGRLHISAVYVPRRQRMEMLLQIPGGLREEEIQKHRRFLESTGFLQPVSSREVVEAWEEVPLVELLDDDEDDEDDEDIPLLEPID